MKRILSLIGAAALCLQAPFAACQGTILPWGQSSDQLAWQTFVQVTAPSGNPNSSQVEFETWASDDDIYHTSPPRWPAPGTPKRLQASLLGTAHRIAVRKPLIISPSDCNPPSNTDSKLGLPANVCIGEEVRRNWASYQYIVSNNLYNAQGLATAYAKKSPVNLPADAVEFKGDWMKVADLIGWLKKTEGLTLTEADIRHKFYVNTATDGKTSADFALLSFHFSTKQIKQWVWSDFENKMNPGRCDDTGCHDSFGAVSSNTPPNGLANQNYGDCQKSEALLAMFKNAAIDPVWRNYCLKGSQTDYVEANTSTPTILGNSVIERITANVPILRSSCISCHAYASFDKDGNHGLDQIVLDPKKYPVGPIDPKILVPGEYVQNDFIWGIIAVPSK
ncbi:hypothetical protein [Caballeronia sordidicola]|nr:hypothetical protein [Caballeronia sordidicola]